MNGQRLTALSAIRAAGDAVLVDFRPLTPPYTIEAVGDPHKLRETFVGGFGGSYLQVLQGYGITYARGGQRPAAAGRVRGCPAALCRRAAACRDEEQRDVIAAIGLVLGIVAGIFLEPTVPTWLQPYLPIAVVAALDAVFGGLRALLDGIFDDRVFVVSFVANVLVAALIVYLGDQLGVGSQLSTGVVVVLGIRIFSNAAAIRRQLFRA